MKRKIYPTLIETAEELTQTEMYVAPELPTLMALDANLLATIRLIEFQNILPGNRSEEQCDVEFGAQEHIAKTIITLAKALRSTLYAYYATIQEFCAEDTCQKEEPF